MKRKKRLSPKETLIQFESFWKRKGQDLQTYFAKNHTFIIIVPGNIDRRQHAGPVTARISHGVLLLGEYGFQLTTLIENEPEPGILLPAQNAIDIFRSAFPGRSFMYVIHKKIHTLKLTPRK